MKHVHIKLRILAAMLLVCITKITLYAQGSEPVEHHVGDIITFKDGSQGIVCYVNPNNPSRGWTAALTDLGEYSMRNADFVLGELKNTFVGNSYDSFLLYFHISFKINNVGRVNTGILRSYGVTAATAVDFSNGWYIPDIVQLSTLARYMMSIPCFQPYKGNFGIDTYWSSTINNNYLLGLSDYFAYYKYSQSELYNKHNIRPVRDFGDEVEAGFVDNEMKPTMTVSPTATESYDALVIYGKDTFNIPVTAEVHPVPSLEITEPSAALCVGSDLKLSATYHTESSSPYFYTWGGDVPVLNPSEPSFETESTTSTRLNAPGTYKFYASVADKNGNCRASDTVEVTAKPFARSPIAIGDEICPYDEAVVVGQNTAATTTQYYRWYDSNKELVKADTMAAGAQTQYTTPPVTAETTYYLAVYDESTCAWDPKFMDLCGTIDCSSLTATDTFLLNASKDGGVSELTRNDYIAFYDEGGKEGAFSTRDISIGWTHTFKAPDGFQVKLKINSFETYGWSYGRLSVYDGTDDSGTLLADLSGTPLSTSGSKTVISTTGTLTVKWTNLYYHSNKDGFEGEISVCENVCYAAEAPVTFKNSPYVSLITSVTDDEVCYNGTAELTATSDLDYPQYFTWWNGDYSEILKQDTLLSAGHSSISLPHQTTDTVYHVTVSNADNCSFAPGMSITSMADAHVSITKLADDAIALTDYDFCPNASDEVLTATFSNVSDTYGVIWVIGDDTVATHLNIPNTQLTDTIHYTAPSTAVCGDDFEYHVILNDLGCSFASGNKHIRLNDTEAPVVIGTLSELFSGGYSAADAPAPATSLSELGITVIDNCSSDFTLSSTDSELVQQCDKTIILRKYIISDECGNLDSIFQEIRMDRFVGDDIILLFHNTDFIPVPSVIEVVAPAPPLVHDIWGNIILPQYDPAQDSIAHINPDGSGTIQFVYHYIHNCGPSKDYTFTYILRPLIFPLVIESNNCELTYNGTEQTCENYTVTYGGEEIPECTTCGSTPGEHKYVVTPGDTITITDPATRRDVTDSVPNTFTVDIPHPEHFSDIDTVFGKIEIDPLAITIIAASDEKMYDGTPLTKDAWTLDPSTPLATGDAIDTTVVTGSITNPGSIPNVPSNTIVVKGTEDVTGNYVIHYVNGTLTVTPSDKPLVIESNNCELTYNGTEQTCENYTVTYGGEEIPECTTCGSTPDEHKYVVTPGDTITITDPATRRDVTDSVPNTFTVDIPHPEHYSDIDTVFGKIEIDPLAITIIAASDEKMYDGTPLTKDAWTLDPSTPLAAGDAIDTTVVTGSITNPGSIPNVPSNTIVVKGTEDVTGNYVIHYVNGTLTVTPSDKPLVIESNNCELTYNGTEQTCENYTVTYGGEEIPECTTCGSTPDEHKYVVTPGDTITITDPATRRDVTDSVPNTFTVDIPNPEHYSDIDTVFGKIEIDPLAITIIAASDEKMYDGTPLTKDAWTLDPSTPLAAGDAIDTTVVTGSITNPGSIPNVPSNTIVVKGTEDVTGNYAIHYVNGTLTVTPSDKPLVIESNNCELTYNGTEQTCEDYTVTFGGEEIPECTTCGSTPDEHKYVVTPGDTITITDPATRRDVTDSVPNTFTVDIPNPEHYSDIDTVFGKIEIDPLAITIIAASDEKMYDGTPLTKDAWTLDPSTPLAAGDAIDTTVVTGSITNPGSTPNVPSNTIVVKGTENVTGNYVIHYVNGTLTVTPSDKPLVIESNNCELTYNGTEQTCENYTVTYGGEEIPECTTCGSTPDEHKYVVTPGDTITITDPATRRDVTDSVPNTFTVDIPNPEHYSDIDTVFGKIEIDPLAITIIAASDEKMYDGTPLTKDAWTLDPSTPLATGDAIDTTVVTGSITNPGSTPNVPSNTIVVKGTENVTGNYVINYINGTLTVRDLDLEIKDIYEDLLCNKSAFAVVPTGSNIPEGTQYKWTVEANPYVTGQSAQTTPVDAPISQTLTNTSDEPQTVTYHVTPIVDGFECVNFNLYVSVLPTPVLSMSCPNNITRTLEFGSCALLIDPEDLGTPTWAHSLGWTLIHIDNNIEELYPGNMYPEGDNVVTWTMTDECGNTTTCEQHVIVIFPQCPDAIDYEGNIYHGVRIDCDCWTQRNLESNKYSDGTDIPGVFNYYSDIYPDIDDNVDKFGRLYDWESAIKDGADNGYGHVQGICPEGWYLPTVEKYEALNLHGADALKSPLYWLDGGGSNSTGFTSLPAGYYDGSINRYMNLMGEAYYWSTTQVNGEVGSSSAVLRYICNDVLIQETREGLGYSVRCIKEKDVAPIQTFSCGTFTVKDHEGNEYNTVKIGDQCWTKENMRCTTSPSTGTNILETSPRLTSESGKKAYYPNGNISNVATYGLLYNWNAAVDTFNTSLGETSNNSDNNNAVDVVFSGNRRGICPEGWHVPSDAEWSTLTSYVKSQSNYVCEGNDYSDDEHRTYYIASALSAPAGWNYFTSGCYPGDVTATTSNKTGFSAVAAGYNWSGFDRFGISAYIWSATQLSDYSAYYRNLGYGNSIVYRGDIDKFTGCSVRCIRDEE